MKKSNTNKKKIINDPVHGFITIPGDLLFDLLEHPYIQRLRRIKQLGMTHLVYPGATHSRFQHTIGCMHLISAAINTLQQKGFSITDEESEAVHAAILMHDLGHAPFSHVLESTLVKKITHEEISLLFMERLNKEFNGKLSMAIEIFKNRYPKRFLHQLISGQLDMDRLDYLRRDSFYTGVSEGVVSSDRIIKMLTLHNDELVVEAKGIYSIEKFLIARRLMFWQVYLHKTALVSEKMLNKTVKRAAYIASKKGDTGAPGTLEFFLKTDKESIDFKNDPQVLNNFAMLDDNDIMSALKIWSYSEDKVLSWLSNALLNRKLLAIEIEKDKFTKNHIHQLREIAVKELSLTYSESKYFVFTDTIENNAYNIFDDKIKILFKNSRVKDISQASDILNLSVLSKTVRKNILCYPKNINEQ
ncbi:HD domain-containing protein [Marinilabiliaceae bacterium ANBcel2]|nr:HD domain-containing protein [Marinilabiliaceae bacterium ANBcel2]